MASAKCASGGVGVLMDMGVIVAVVVKMSHVRTSCHIDTILTKYTIPQIFPVCKK